MNDLKQRTIRGGLAGLCAQSATFLLRTGSLILMARLLEPKDFGLVGMVTAVIGILNRFKDCGLSTATIQRATVTEEQISTLFWINVLVGSVLTVLSLALAPVIAAFYHEPRLLGVTSVVAASFILNAAGVQHSALLQRQMRFTTMAAIDTLSLLTSIVVGIGMALSGFGYWALVAMALTLPAVSTSSLWATTAWIPAAPRKHVGIRSMMRFGGTVTLNSLIIYVAYNLDQVLLGRFWGAQTVGIYGRGSQLVTIPADSISSAVGGVALAALSRLQGDPSRLRSYFLKGYSLLLTVSIPITVASALFAPDVIFVLLGTKWTNAAPIARLLAPTVLSYAIINPFGWLLFALGRVGRSLKIALVITPLTVAGCLIGLPYGPKGVALGYSVVMVLWVVPHIVWCVKGTPISVRDILLVTSRPLLSALIAGAFLFSLHVMSDYLSPLSRVVIGTALFLGAYSSMLLWVLNQKDFYVDLLRQLAKRSSSSDSALVAG